MLNGHLHCPLPDDIDKPLNGAAAEKIREYCADYNNRPSNSFSSMPAVATTLCKIYFFTLSWIVVPLNPHVTEDIHKTPAMKCCDDHAAR
jgi:hypothetical protein